MLIKEYEEAYRHGEFFYSSITLNEKIHFKGLETTKLLLNNAKSLRQDLDDQENPIFSEAQEEAQMKIWSCIEALLEPLSCRVVNKITSSIHCQKGLSHVLREAIENSSVLQHEAQELLVFIKNSKQIHWGALDENYKNKFFKLVESKEDFETLLSQQIALELIPDKSNTFSRIRIAFARIDCETIYRKKHLLRKYKHFYKLLSSKGYHYGIQDAFNFWYGVSIIGIYFVYVPYNH